MAHKVTDTLFNFLYHCCLALLCLDTVLVAYRYNVKIVNALK